MVCINNMALANAPTSKWQGWRDRDSPKLLEKLHVCVAAIIFLFIFMQSAEPLCCYKYTVIYV
jgi:hypothetical protein